MRWDPFVTRKDVLTEDRLSAKPMLSLAGKPRGAEELCSPLGREQGFQGLRWFRKQTALR